MNAHSLRTILLLLTLIGLARQTLTADDAYPLGPDSQVQNGVPQGKIAGPISWSSKVFPGTVRDYWVYVPAQYDSGKPTCLMVVQDGLNRAKNWRMTVAMDNLIHKKEMPVTIGIFINPGVVPPPHKDAQARYNRSFEYDSMGDRYARFLLTEILPEVGKTYNLSDDPNDRAIAGASSGAICAFNVAWERPDAFRRVLSTIGTFVGLRGANEFPVLIRKVEPKPIRVFLQDGRNDLNLYGGSWWVANQDMLSAFEFAGYDVKHAWGTGGHDSKQAAAIMPAALRWLWRDYPQPISAGVAPVRRTQIMIPGEDWELVSQGHKFTEGPAVNAAGEVFFTDIPHSRIHKIGLDGKVTVFAENTGKANGLMFDATGRLLACANEKQQIVAYSPAGDVEVLAENVANNDLVAGHHGVYFTDPGNKRLYHIDAAGRATVADLGIERPNGIAFSPDQSLLYVSDTSGQFVYSFQIQADGRLAHKQPFFHLHLPYGQTSSGADGMTVDTEGRVYVTTQMGLQICDQPGRVHLILRKPQDAWLSNVAFGGPKLETLFVTCGDKVFKRKVNATGVVSARGAQKPPRPRL